MDKLEIETIYPKDPVIQQYVDYYYILNSKKKHLDISYLAFPHLHQPLIFFEDTEVLIDGIQHHLNFNREAKAFCGVINRFAYPLPVTITGKIRTINIIFKPLGLNSFISKPYAQLIKNVFQKFDQWKLDQKLVEELFTLSKTQLSNKLDELLLANHIPFFNETIFKAIKLMSSVTEDAGLKRIEQLLNVNRKTLFRLFTTHTGVSPTTFRRIMRFRQTLDINNIQDISLTALAYEANFTDQSHFIKEVQKLTGDTPSSFFRTADYVNGSKLLIKTRY